MELLVLLVVATVAALLVLRVLRGHQAKYGGHVQKLQPQAKKPKRQLVVGAWTREEVAKHTSMEDCWIVIQDQSTKEWKVYDVTDYIDEHPGGTAIMTNAGGDATAGFHGPQHPHTVFEMVNEFCIGTLVDP